MQAVQVSMRSAACQISAVRTINGTVTLPWHSVLSCHVSAIPSSVCHFTTGIALHCAQSRALFRFEARFSVWWAYVSSLSIKLPTTWLHQQVVQLEARSMHDVARTDDVCMRIDMDKSCSVPCAETCCNDSGRPQISLSRDVTIRIRLTLKKGSIQYY